MHEPSEPVILLRKVRDDHFMSQAELAEASGVSKATIGNIETGKQKPHPRTTRALAKAMDVDPREIVPQPSLLHTRTPPLQQGSSGP